MIDIHSHLIFGVDDGSSSIEESIKMIEAAEKNNVRTIVATPHFQDKIFINEGVLENYEILLYKASNFDVRIKLGNEVYADDSIISFIKNQRKVNVDNLPYVLLEFPLNATIEEGRKLIGKISALNLKTIVAHPERNRNLTKNLDEFVAFVNDTKCGVQIEAGSIVGVYGTHVKKVTKQLLKLKVVDFMATNAHYSQDYSLLYPRAVEKIHKLCDDEYAYKILESNANEIITTSDLKSKYTAI